MIPYTTKTGVQIGIRYKRPPPPMYRDEERLQAALLGIKSPRFPSLAWFLIAALFCYLVAGIVAKSV